MVKRFLITLVITLVLSGILWVYKEYAKQKEEVIKQKEATALEVIIRNSDDLLIEEAYKNPSKFDTKRLEEFFDPEGAAIKFYQRLLQQMIESKKFYGKESTVMGVRIKTVDITKDGSEAEVTTNEFWYIPLYQIQSDGKIKQVDVNPYQRYSERYRFRKVKGQWLINKNTWLPFQPKK